MELLKEILSAMSEPLAPKIYKRAKVSKGTFYDVYKGKWKNKAVIDATISVIEEKQNQLTILIKKLKNQLN